MDLRIFPYKSFKFWHTDCLGPLWAKKGLNYSIRGHLFAFYWIKVEPIVICLVLQKLPTHVNEVNRSGRNKARSVEEYLIELSVNCSVIELNRTQSNLIERLGSEIEPNRTKKFVWELDWFSLRTQSNLIEQCRNHCNRVYNTRACVLVFPYHHQFSTIRIGSGTRPEKHPLMLYRTYLANEIERNRTQSNSTKPNRT